MATSIIYRFEDEQAPTWTVDLADNTPLPPIPNIGDTVVMNIEETGLLLFRGTVMDRKYIYAIAQHSGTRGSGTIINTDKVAFKIELILAR